MGLARTRYAAGIAYAELVEDERIARGLKPKFINAMGETHVRNALTYQQQMAWREMTEMKLKKAEDVLREVDNLTVKVIRTLAYEGNEISPYCVGRQSMAYTGLRYISGWKSGRSTADDDVAENPPEKPETSKTKQ